MSFLLPNFTPIHFPNGTPAMPMHPQPQYPSSDISSSTLSTPASTRSTSSNSSGNKDKHKARIYNQDPKYPTNAPIGTQSTMGSAPSATSLVALPIQSGIRRKSGCSFCAAMSPATGPTPIPAGVTTLCLPNPCTKGNKRNCNAACTNKMCKEAVS
ncbi:hypothetical protein M407DRAFT_30890 [Tulasnella calospora MUT 4182]|uniref:Uncharacterized protein n=1 Tax=Tulasnella calospora MUT 4182 TaxID=1051891 RepID=A0A0C3LDD4_9AGAM|nr:hypothetical protein M407DRAFT_30890 [Tulasnella calospora MUT 4182]